MDPNAALQELREIAAVLVDGCPEETAAELGIRMSELFAGLDNWIIRGGFLPRAWSK